VKLIFLIILNYPEFIIQNKKKIKNFLKLKMSSEEKLPTKENKNEEKYRIHVCGDGGVGKS
jgi:hypothetical protein